MFALVAFALLGSVSARAAAVGHWGGSSMGQVVQRPMMRSDDGSDGFNGFPSDGNGLPTVFDPNSQDGQIPDQFQPQFPGQFPGQFQQQFPDQFQQQFPGQFQQQQFPNQFPQQFPTQPSFDPQSQLQSTQTTAGFNVQLPPFPIGNGASIGLQHSIEIGVLPMNVPKALQLATDANMLQLVQSQQTALNSYQVRYNNQQLCMYKFLIGSNPQTLSCMVTDCTNNVFRVGPLDCNQYDDIRDDSSSLVPTWVPQDEFNAPRADIQ